MRRLKVLSLAVAGIILPVALAFAAYFISTGFGASASISTVPGTELRTTPSNSDRHGLHGDDQPKPTDSPGGDRCSEPEHSADLTCTTSGNSGPGSLDDNGGSGGGGSDDNSNSGPGGPSPTFSPTSNSDGGSGSGSGSNSGTSNPTPTPTATSTSGGGGGDGGGGHG